MRSNRHLDDSRRQNQYWITLFFGYLFMFQHLLGVYLDFQWPNQSDYSYENIVFRTFTALYALAFLGWANLIKATMTARISCVVSIFVLLTTLTFYFYQRNMLF